MRLVGPDGSIVKRKLPLKMTLLYSDNQLVINQDILQPQPTSQNEISSTTGLAVLKVRIIDVSKNHQSKNFKIRVEPDTTKSPLHNDVAPSITNEVEIRSKVNKQRQKKKASRKKGASSSVPLLANAPESFLPEGGKVPKSLDASTKKALKLAAWCDTVKDMLAGLNGMLQSPVINQLLIVRDNRARGAWVSQSAHTQSSEKVVVKVKACQAVSIYDNFMDYMFTDNSVGKGGISAATSNRSCSARAPPPGMLY